MSPVQIPTSVAKSNNTLHGNFLIRYSLFIIRYSLFIIRYSFYI